MKSPEERRRGRWREFSEGGSCSAGWGDGGAEAAGLAAAVKRLGGARGFADYRRMLDEVKPDFVSVCPRWLD
jgi:predicted dehydrogenase